MLKKGFLLRSLLVGCMIMGLSVAAYAERPKGESKERQSLAKGSAEKVRYQILNINNLWSWIRNDGWANHSPSDDDGTYYPRSTGSCVYQDGLMWGGKCYVDAGLTIPAPNSQLIRVGGANYVVGTREGWIVGSGPGAVAADPNDVRTRSYRIRRDYSFMTDEEKQRDADDYFELTSSGGTATSDQVATVSRRYDDDWKEWPGDLGAPYIERNGIPGYQAPPPFSETFSVDSLISQKQDEPGVAGADPNSPADQVIWTVYNDLDANLTVSLQASDPIGLEVQVTMWAYKRTDALGNIYFKRYKMFNKGGVRTDAGGAKGSFYIDSMYVCQWSDIDLGDSGDDLIGCDEDLSMGFTYNALAQDSEYRQFNLAPPADGYDFLQGPIIPSPGDSAVFDLKRVQDFKNLPMSAFSYFSAGSVYSDPTPRNYQSTLKWYKLMRGFVPLDGPDTPYPFPPGETPTKFPYNGDPVTKAGFVDGQGTQYSFAPGDRRILVNTGPFSLKPGDVQEIVVALVVGLGSDRLSSVSVMKFNDRFAQNTYNALFQVAKPPAKPNAKVTELDGEVILEWGSDLARVNDTEGRINNPGTFRFEGYNVYQFPRRNSSISEATRIATYDLPDDPSVVLDEQFDPESGQILNLPVQFGSNSGVTRQFRFARDYVSDVDKIYNGQEYFLAVTAYSVSDIDGYTPTSLESEPQLIIVTPKRPFGESYQYVDAEGVTKTAEYGAVLPVTHATGASDGIVTPTIVDPKVASSGDTYEVTFEENEGAVIWTLTNVTKNVVVLADQTNQSGDTNYKIVDGMFMSVAGPPPGVKDWSWAGTRFLTWAGGEGLAFEGFNGALGWASPRSVFGDGVQLVTADKTKNIEIRFANAGANDLEFDPNHPNVSYAYRHGRSFGGAPAKPEFAPFIINTAGGYSYQDFTKSVPFAVYDVDANPPRRLALAFLENNAAGGKVDGRYNPNLTGTTPNNTDGAGPREWVFIFDSDYSETPNPAFQVEIIGASGAATDGVQPVMYFATWLRRNANAWTDTDVMTVLANKPNTPTDVFRFTAANTVADVASQTASFQNIGVYPNPYYAFNPAEETTINHFITFNNLPPTVTIRIFNLAGQLVRTLEKVDNPDQFMRWDLQNQTALPVASGMYIAYVEGLVPANGQQVSKVVKFAVIQEQEVLDTF